MNSYLFSEIKEGLKESFSVEITDEVIKSFISVCGDTNPLHVDSDYAKSKGFESCLVHGMLVSSFYSTLCGMYLPGKYCVLHGIDISFAKPVFSGDILDISGEVKYINEAYKQLEIKSIISNHKGQKVSKATIKAGVIDE